MALTTYTASNDTLPALINDLNAQLLTLTSRTVVGVGFIGVDKPRSTGVELSVYAVLDSGGQVSTNPFQIVAFEGTNVADAADQVADYMTANPSFFFAPPIFVKLDTTRRIKRDIAVLFYTEDAAEGLTNWIPYGAGGGGGAGTVTSVALTMPAIFAVGGSPVTTAGTLAVTLATQLANVIFAGPAAGGAAIPTFRALVAADIPNLSAASITSGTLAVARGGTGVDGSAAANGTVLIGNGTGYTLATITGTTNRLTVTNGAGSITLDIAATYVGQTSITTLGTIATGVWNGTTVGAQYGGTGVNGAAAANGRVLIGNGTGYTLANITGAVSRLSVTNGAGSITLDIDAGYVGQTSITTLGTLTAGTWNADIIAAAYGGTGVDASAAANGQLLIGDGAGFALATITGTAARLSVTNGAGTITLDIDATYVGQTSITTLGTVTTGTWNATAVAAQYGGTGINGATAANGTLLIGNGSGYTLATITAGNDITVTNGAGSITITLPTTIAAAHTYTGLSTFSAAVYSTPVVLTDAATIATNAALGNLFEITLGASRTMGAPTNPVNGQTLTYRIRQSGAGAFTITWNAVFVFTTSIPAPTLTATLNKLDLVSFTYDGTNSVWRVLATNVQN